MTGLRERARGILLDPVTRRQERIALGIAFAAVALAALLQSRAVQMPQFPVDDAYITIHNADVLRSGRDTAFPGVSAFAGATSPIHLVLVTATSLLLPTAWASWVWGWVAASLYLAGVVRLVASAGGSLAAVTAALVASWAAGDAALQLMNGLETGLALAALVWCFVFLLEEREAGDWRLPLLVSQLPFLRPELAPLALLLIAERWLSRPGPRRRFVADILVLATGAAPWLVLNQLAFGAPIPQTITVKQSYFAEGCEPRSWKLKVVARELLGFGRSVGLFAAGFALLVLRRLGRLLLLFCTLFVAAYYFSFPGALGHFDHRYLHALLPASLLGWALALRGSRPEHRAAAIGGLLASAVVSLVLLPGSLDRYLAHLDEDTAEARRVAEFLASRVPAGEKLLVHDIGYLSTVLPHEMVDFVGLKSPQAARLHRRVTLSTCGRLRPLVVHELAVAQAPRHLVLLDDWDRVYRISRGLERLGWGLTPMREPGVAYQVYALTAPERPPRVELATP